MPYVYNAADVQGRGPFAAGNRFLFTGREWLKDLKVYDYRNRMYQPELGRFLQPDPQEFARAITISTVTVTMTLLIGLIQWGW